MKKLLTQLSTIAALLLAVAPGTFAQTAAPTAAYTGPRFPGGPDSLRALVYRSTRVSGVAPAGQILVQFELKPDGQPQIFQLVPPPKPASRELLQAAATALNYLEARMPAWQPGIPDPKAAHNEIPKVWLALDFTTAQTTQPYAYADQDPTFPDLAGLLHAQHNDRYERSLRNNAVLARLKPSPGGLPTYIQMQTTYPAAALRQRQQGQVCSYFEVAESGAIERRGILGTAGEALDSEVLRVLNLLPNATTPPLVQGRPARVFYVIPSSFKIQ